MMLLRNRRDPQQCLQREGGHSNSARCQTKQVLPLWYVWTMHVEKGLGLALQRSICHLAHFDNGPPTRGTAENRESATIEAKCSGKRDYDQKHISIKRDQRAYRKSHFGLGVMQFDFFCLNVNRQMGVSELKNGFWAINHWNHDSCWLSN